MEDQFSHAMMSAEILISAGEPSGEMYAARLATALRERTGARLFGLGGPAMRRAGVDLVADSSQVAVVGITEAVRRLPAAWQILHRLVQESARRSPRLAILVDFPDFNLRLGRRLRQQGVRIVYFISPQVWAWRPKRVEVIKRLVERMIVIFPFEEEFYGRAGVPVDYVGHPLVDGVRAKLGRAEFVARYGLDPARTIVGLLPGSRAGEIAHHLPGMLDACASLNLAPAPQFVLAAAPGLDAADFSRYFRPDLLVRVMENAAYDVFAASDCAIVSSGTATVEAALLGAPMVVVYRVSRTTAFVARRMVRTPFYSMVNLIAGKAIVPELIQDDFTAKRLADEVRRLLGSPEAREAMKKDLATVRARLGAAGPGGAIERAAEIIARLL